MLSKDPQSNRFAARFTYGCRETCSSAAIKSSPGICGGSMLRGYPSIQRAHARGWQVIRHVEHSFWGCRSPEGQHSEWITVLPLLPHEKVVGRICYSFFETHCHAGFLFCRGWGELCFCGAESSKRRRRRSQRVEKEDRTRPHLMQLYIPDNPASESAART